MGVSSTVLRALGVIVLLGALVVGGLWVGAQLRADGARALAPAGTLMEVHLEDGTVYLGDVTNESDAYLQLSAAAVIVPEQGEEEATYRVQPLTGEPYSLVGPVAIARDRISLIGVVSAGSPVQLAYQDAMAGASMPSPTPS